MLPQRPPLFKKSLLETCKHGDFNIDQDTIKIPLFFLGKRGNEEKTKVSEEESLVSRKKIQSIIDEVKTNVDKRMSPKQDTIQKHSFFDNKVTLPNVSRSHDLKAFSLPSKNEETHQMKKAEDDNSEFENVRAIRVSIKPSLPAIKFKDRKTKSKDKKSLKKEIEHSRILEKTKELKKCYVNPTIYCLRERSLSKSRLKTESDVENEYILERILTVKPSKDLSRETLSENFKKHKYYKRIREKKLTCTPIKIYQIQRSKTTNSRHELLQL